MFVIRYGHCIHPSMLQLRNMQQQSRPLCGHSSAQERQADFRSLDRHAELQNLTLQQPARLMGGAKV